jgi:hypothetical protein
VQHGAANNVKLREIPEKRKAEVRQSG